MTLIKFKRPEHKDPEVELVARLIDRAESEGTVQSEEPDNSSIIGLQEGFMVAFMNEDNGCEGLAYKKHKGREIELRTGLCKTRDEAGRRLFKYIRSFNKGYN